MSLIFGVQMLVRKKTWLQRQVMIQAAEMVDGGSSEVSINRALQNMMRNLWEKFCLKGHQPRAESYMGEMDKFCSRERESEKCGGPRRKPDQRWRQKKNQRMGQGMVTESGLKQRQKTSYGKAGRRGAQGGHIQQYLMLLQMHREKGLSKDERTVITKSF